MCHFEYNVAEAKFDLCEAYYCLHHYYHMGGFVPEFAGSVAYAHSQNREVFAPAQSIKNNFFHSLTETGKKWFYQIIEKHGLESFNPVTDTGFGECLVSALENTIDFLGNTRDAAKDVFADFSIEWDEELYMNALERAHMNIQHSVRNI